MKLIYKVAVKSYARLLKSLSPFNTKAAKWVAGRSGLTEQLLDVDQTTHWIWFHCASLGEFEQGRPVMEKFIQQNPDWSLLITFFSPSGYEVQKDFEYAKKVMYLPLENKENISQFMDAFNPRIAVFVKYEFWYGYMESLFTRNIPLVFISSTFRKKQVFFKWYGKWFLNKISDVNMFFVQDDYSLKLLKEYNVSKVIVAGDTRFDRVYQTYLNSESFSLLQEFKKDHKVLIFGSAWAKETQMAVKIISQLPEGWKVIYAPHEIDPEKIQDFQNEIAIRSTLFTTMELSDALEAKVLILNTIGHLARCYKYSDVAVIGGGFTDGIHNILEPLVFGVPVAFGPIHEKFWEAEEAIEHKVGFVITNQRDFLGFFSIFSKSENTSDEISVKCHEFIIDRIGATKKIGKYLNGLVQ